MERWLATNAPSVTGLQKFQAALKQHSFQRHAAIKRFAHKQPLVTMRAVGDVVGVLLVNRIIVKANGSATIDAKLRSLPAVQGKQMAARGDGQAVHTLLIGKPNFQRLVFFAKTQAVKQLRQSRKRFELAAVVIKLLVSNA